MSIINRLKSNGHLDDAAFAEIWTDVSLSGAAPANAHLQGCPLCQSRFADFSAWLEDLRVEAATDAEEAFPAERLASQHAAVMRRLEVAAHPARVIAFPKFARPISSNTSHAHRWIAAAAAAGLIVGVGVGQLMDLRRTLTPPVRAVETRSVTPAAQRSNAAIQQVSATLTDDALMARIEVIASQGVPDSLVALDSMTPRARDYTGRSR